MRWRNGLLLTVAVACVSASAPLIAACSAPATAIAFWRCALGGALTACWLAVVRARWRVGRGQWSGVGVAAFALAAHFAVWIPSLRLTTVALSTAMISTQPVWSVLIERLQGVPVRRMAWVGVLVCVAGVILMLGPSGPGDSADLFGMGLALAGAVLAAVYVAAGRSVRSVVPAGAYTTWVYLLAAGLLLVLAALSGVRLLGFPAPDWVLIASITLVAQIGGHSLLNVVVRRTSASVVSTAILFEAPGAAVIAALTLGQPVSAAVWIGLVVMVAGLVLVVRSLHPDVAEAAV